MRRTTWSRRKTSGEWLGRRISRNPNPSHDMTEPAALALYDADEHVGIVTMNRPDKLNAISPEFKTALMRALQTADDDPKTSVVLLRANGRSFCVGYDIGRKSPERDAWRHDAVRYTQHLREAMAFEFAPWDMRKPVIAEVQGHALGGGCELAMMCDLTIAAEDAQFGEPEIRFSTVGPGLVMPWFIGLKKARELLYFGDTIDAHAALELGMINRVVPRDELPAQALKFAKRLALVSPEALAVTKLAINRGAEAAGFRNAINIGVDVVGPLYATATTAGTKFRAMVETDGLGIALKARMDQFKE
jgi:enoyl-CoA hydratase/carnithine racemase